MDAISTVIKQLEGFIRVGLSGAAVLAIVADAQAKRQPVIDWVEEHPVVGGVVVLLLGLAVYAVYRLVVWCIVDLAAWVCGALRERKAACQAPHIEFADFFDWRHGAFADTSLSRYLHYRWAHVHFALILSVSLFIGTLQGKDCCLLRSHAAWAWVTLSSLFVFGVWQMVFLIATEKRLRFRKPGYSK